MRPSRLASSSSRARAGKSRWRESPTTAPRRSWLRYRRRSSRPGDGILKFRTQLANMRMELAEKVRAIDEAPVEFRGLVETKLSVAQWVGSARSAAKGEKAQCGGDHIKLLSRPP